MSVLVDSNVLLDVLTEDPAWIEWSSGMLERHAEEHVLLINPIIYAEVSIGFNTIEQLDEALPAAYLRREPLPWDAGFLAGKAFLRYRRSGGVRLAVLPDFYIGAHASLGGHTLLTRDAQRYRTYFPRLRLIAPD